MAWTSTWNSHVLSRRGQLHQSPQDMYVQGMVTNGVRGVQLEHQGINPEEYGIDWEELDQRRIRQHHLANTSTGSDRKQRCLLYLVMPLPLQTAKGLQIQLQK